MVWPPPQALSSAALLFGFPHDELETIGRHAVDLFGDSQLPLLHISQPHVDRTLQDLLSADWGGGAGAGAGTALKDGAAVEAAVLKDGRLIFFVGAAQQHAATINDKLLELGIAPAVVGGRQPRQVCVQGGQVNIAYSPPPSSPSSLPAPPIPYLAPPLTCFPLPPTHILPLPPPPYTSLPSLPTPLTPLYLPPPPLHTHAVQP